MLLYPRFDPIMFSIGPLHFRWYGMMYVFGVVSGWLLGRSRARKSWSVVTPGQFDDYITWAVIGVVLGGRIGYVLFYNLSYYIANPLDVFAVWQGGMSFHGGLIGVILMSWFFARRQGLSLMQITDFVAPLVPPGLFFGRIGNFINSELWGRRTHVDWAMVFPGSDGLPRHPSQLYEAGLEGVALFLILWFYSRKQRPTGSVSGLFLIAYGIFRFLIEFTREPDAQLGFVALHWMSMGQVLCIPMLALGIYLMLRGKRQSGIETNA
ncbi:prolipoprotein diacylglyceryl transferase [Pseudodesulfovibrio sp.]|uniref:prolipoprotein diacylglyceryl transferase n=1 Tax=unclassified Pseudodesulfovibrio TaxID=2661612 RepID=UPI003B002A61